VWIIRNKALIEGTFINSPYDDVYKTIVFMQLWTPRVRMDDRDGSYSLISKIKTKIAELRHVDQ
jgi:hypothetical protein